MWLYSRCSVLNSGEVSDVASSYSSTGRRLLGQRVDNRKLARMWKYVKRAKYMKRASGNQLDKTKSHFKGFRALLAVLICSTATPLLRAKSKHCELMQLDRAARELIQKRDGWFVPVRKSSKHTSFRNQINRLADTFHNWPWSRTVNRPITLQCRSRVWNRKECMSLSIFDSVEFMSAPDCELDNVIQLDTRDTRNTHTAAANTSLTVNSRLLLFYRTHKLFA